MTIVFVKMPPSSSYSLSAIQSNLIKKAAITFYTPNSITAKPGTNLPYFITFAISKEKIMNKLYPDKQNFMSLVANYLLPVHDQIIPPEIPGENPSEFPRNPGYSSLEIPPEIPELPKTPEIESIPPEVITETPNIPEIPTPGPDYPVPLPQTPPDIPLPPPGTPRPPPPDQLPPGLPPDPDILPPPINPRPDIQPPLDVPPEIKPPPGLYVSFAF